jgi:hypothetical protein
VNSFLVWLADSPLNVFVWLMYVARIVYLIAEAWWMRRRRVIHFSTRGTY